MIGTTEPAISRRHRILIAAAAAAVAGPLARVREIKPLGWSQLRPGYKEAPVLRPVHNTVPVHIRTARKERSREVANLA